MLELRYCDILRYQYGRSLQKVMLPNALKGSPLPFPESPKDMNQQGKKKVVLYMVQIGAG